MSRAFYAYAYDRDYVDYSPAGYEAEARFLFSMADDYQRAGDRHGDEKMWAAAKRVRARAEFYQRKAKEFRN